MGWKRQLAKLRSLHTRAQAGADVEDEIRSHLEMEERENLESGMPPEEAHYAALRRFGNVTSAQQRSREMWQWNSIQTFWQDIQSGTARLTILGAPHG